MAAIHSLSDNLQGILVDLSEKIEKMEIKNTELEERTKELETKEIDSKVKIEEMVVENKTLQDRVTVLESQLNAETESKLKELIEIRQTAAESRILAAEEKVQDHDKLVDRLESCEKKLASFYGDDTNILGRVGHLETRFKDFKKNEDIKLAQQIEGLEKCTSQNEMLRGRVDAVEEGLALARRLTDILHETKLDKAEVVPVLDKFKSDNRLLDEDSIIDVTDMAYTNRENVNALSQSERERVKQLDDALDKIREDIETLQQNTEPAHKYECFGSDQAVKIYQIEAKLKELEGISAASVEGRLQQMDGRIDSTTAQMDRVLSIESFFTNNFDRIGQDYVHLSRLISEINEELHGNEQKLQDFVNEMRSAGRSLQPATRASPASDDDEKMGALSKDIKAIEKMINSADYRMSAFADECKESLLEMQSNNDKKIDILAVWVSKNINLLASSTRKKFKQLMAGADMGGALLAGQSRAGHCLSCNQTKRPFSASHPKTRVTEGKSPIFKIRHVDQEHAGDNHFDNNNNNNNNNETSLMSDSTEGGGGGGGGGIGPAFKMTVPTSLRMKVSNFRQNAEDERLADGSDSAAFEDTAGRLGDERSGDVKDSNARKFFKSPNV